MQIRELILIDREIRAEAGRELRTPARQVAACAVLKNPLAGRTVDDHARLVELSVEAGRLLSRRALAALGARRAVGYGKAALVGTGGDLEHGAAMIHVRIGLAMRRALRRGRALIPGNAKVGGPGQSIDVVFGGIDDAWDYDSMDTMQVSVPGAPRADEILLVVAFLAGGRPNARIKGAPASAAEELVRSMQRRRR